MISRTPTSHHFPSFFKAHHPCGCDPSARNMSEITQDCPHGKAHREKLWPVNLNSSWSKQLITYRMDSFLELFGVALQGTRLFPGNRDGGVAKRRTIYIQ